MHLNQIAEGLKKSSRPSKWNFDVLVPGPDLGMKSQLGFFGFELFDNQTHFLRLHTEKVLMLGLTFGRAGEKNRGFRIAAVQLVSAEGKKELLGKPFLINFAEGLEGANKRFQKWFKPLLLQGLNRWRELNLAE